MHYRIFFLHLSKRCDETIHIHIYHAALDDFLCHGTRVSSLQGNRNHRIERAFRTRHQLSARRTAQSRTGGQCHSEIKQQLGTDWVRFTKGICLLQILEILSFAPKGKLSACQIVFRFFLMEFLVNSMEHHYLGTRYLFGTGGAVLAAENTHYLLFHRIGQPYLYVQAVESSFLLS